MEEELTKKERKDLKREERRAGQSRDRKVRKVRKLVAWIASIVLVVVVGWFGIQVLTPESLGEDYSRAMPNEGATHVEEGTRVEYQSNPPTSGNHWPTPLRSGAYDTEKPDEGAVHGLEHGRIWITYKPDIGEEAISALLGAMKGQFGVIINPRAANDTDIALAAWMRLDTFDIPEDGVLDTKRILDFTQRYRNKGPEYVPQMTGKTYE